MKCHVKRVSTIKRRVYCPIINVLPLGQQSNRRKKQRYIADVIVNDWVSHDRIGKHDDSAVISQLIQRIMFVVSSYFFEHKPGRHVLWKVIQFFELLFTCRAQMRSWSYQNNLINRFILNMFWIVATVAVQSVASQSSVVKLIFGIVFAHRGNDKFGFIGQHSIVLIQFGPFLKWAFAQVVAVAWVKNNSSIQCDKGLAQMHGKWAYDRIGLVELSIVLEKVKVFKQRGFIQFWLRSVESF